MRKGSTLDGIVVWAVSILLAAVFLLAGLPKLLGTETVGLQAAAMRGFPGWIRILVGMVETVGGIALLMPPIATFAALLLAAAMVPASISQYHSGEPGLFVPITVGLLLLFVAWRRNAERVSQRYRDMAGTPHAILYEGIIAGCLGATVIALWFLVIDVLGGRPFFTPATLGRGLLSALAPGATYTPTTHVLVYTVFHFAAFMLVGLLAALIVDVAKREPSILFAFLLLFAVTEVGIYALVALLQVATPLGRNAWLQIMAGNVLAALVMGTFFWRRHRELVEQFRHSLDYPAPSYPPPPASSDGAPLSPPVMTAHRSDEPDGEGRGAPW